MSTLNEKELLKIQVHNLKLALRKKQAQLDKIKEEHTNEVLKIKKEYGMKLLNLRITMSTKKVPGDNYLPILCNILHSITGTSAKDILGKSRKREYVIPRYIIMHILRMEGKTLQYIGRVIGNHHHSTVLHSIKCVEDWLNYPDYYRPEYQTYTKAKKIFDDLKK
jgi:chromosomal replication initiation ATPase DnaA